MPIQFHRPRCVIASPETPDKDLNPAQKLFRKEKDRLSAEESRARDAALNKSSRRRILGGWVTYAPKKTDRAPPGKKTVSSEPPRIDLNMSSGYQDIGEEINRMFDAYAEARDSGDQKLPESRRVSTKPPALPPPSPAISAWPHAETIDAPRSSALRASSFRSRAACRFGSE